jgi:uncharacterized protein YggT (Ycf19 family)
MQRRRARGTGGTGAQLLTELLIAAYAIVSAFVIVRFLLLSVGIADSLWVGAVVYGVTDPVVSFMHLVPGGSFEIVGRATLADLTLLATVFAVPFIILARRPHQ